MLFLKKTMSAKAFAGNCMVHRLTD